MLKESKHLRIAGILEIIIGAVMLIFTWQLAGAGDFSDVIDEGLANKALLLGLILFVMNLWEFFIYANDVTQIILHAITLIVPY